MSRVRILSPAPRPFRTTPYLSSSRASPGKYGPMPELEDGLDLGSSAVSRLGSIPSRVTICSYGGIGIHIGFKYQRRKAFSVRIRIGAPYLAVAQLANAKSLSLFNLWIRIPPARPCAQAGAATSACRTYIQAKQIKPPPVLQYQRSNCRLGLQPLPTVEDRHQSLNIRGSFCAILALYEMKVKQIRV